MQKHGLRSADGESMKRRAVTVDSSWVNGAPNAVMATTLRSESVGSLRMVVAEWRKYVKSNHDQVSC